MKKPLIAISALMLSACSGQHGDEQRQVADLLKDPSSAEFREVRALGECVVGEVNGKNSFGAYSGFTEFLVDNQGPVLKPEPGRLMDPDPAEIAKVVAETDFLRRHTACLEAA